MPTAAIKFDSMRYDDFMTSGIESHQPMSWQRTIHSGMASEAGSCIQGFAESAIGLTVFWSSIPVLFACGIALYGTPRFIFLF